MTHAGPDGLPGCPGKLGHTGDLLTVTAHVRRVHVPLHGPGTGGVHSGVKTSLTLSQYLPGVQLMTQVGILIGNINIDEGEHAEG